jgi:hypothetical protein
VSRARRCLLLCVFFVSKVLEERRGFEDSQGSSFLDSIHRVVREEVYEERGSVFFEDEFNLSFKDNSISNFTLTATHQKATANGNAKKLRPNLRRKWRGSDLRIR